MSQQQPVVPFQDGYSIVFNLYNGGGSAKQGKQIIGKLPENFEFSVQSEFSQPFQDVINSLFNPQAVNALQAASGVRLTTQELTTQIWQGTQPIRLQLPVTFYARTNARLDVSQNVYWLTEAALPRRLGGKGTALVGPGPQIDVGKILNGRGLAEYWDTLKKAAETGNLGSPVKTNGTNSSTAAVATNGLSTSILQYKPNTVHSVRIGRRMFIQDVVIENVQTTYDTKFDRDGYPMKAVCNVSMITARIPVSDELGAMMGVSNVENNFRD